MQNGGVIAYEKKERKPVAENHGAVALGGVDCGDGAGSGSTDRPGIGKCGGGVSMSST